jgi:hypothetical protein
MSEAPEAAGAAAYAEVPRAARAVAPAARLGEVRVEQMAASGQEMIGGCSDRSSGSAWAAFSSIPFPLGGVIQMRSLFWMRGRG